MTYYERNKKDILEKRKQHYLSKKMTLNIKKKEKITKKLIKN